ncbi:MAG: right-handed parallel beta-helix repeat-containing protein [Verrucomicrobiales bacterium]
MSDVRQFGAAGDGRTDDTAAIRHAIKDGDGLLEFPKGRYRISGTIEIPVGARGPCAITGDAGTATVVMVGAGPAFRLAGNHAGTGDPGSVTPPVRARERMPTVRGLCIEGEHPEADGFELGGTMQAVFDVVMVRQVRHAIHLVGRNRNVIITNCHLYHNTGVGIFMDGLNLHQINITGSHISYNRLGGIRIERSEIRNLQITGNDIEYNNAKSHAGLPSLPCAEIWIDTRAGGASVNEVTIASNTIQATESAGGANIRIVEKPDASRPPGLIAITGNVIGSQENNVHLSSCYGVTISGNTIYSCGKRNLLIEDSRLISIGSNHFRRHTPAFGTGVRLVRSQDCTISGCTFHDESEEGQASGASLLEIERCERVAVSGCSLSDGVPYGIDARASSQVVITGCTIAETREPPRASGALRFSGRGDGNQVALNSIAGNTEIAPESGVTE